MSTQGEISFEEVKYPETAILKAVGDIIQGEVVEVGEVDIEGRQAGYLHIKTKNGIRTLWLGKVLTQQCEGENVKKGDYIGIKYLGEVDSGKQNPYKNYDMRVIPKDHRDDIFMGGIEG